jgi:sulfur relay protein TusB/DsrH
MMSGGVTDSRNGEPCLHLVLSARPDAWEDCSRHSQAGDTAVLADDGVMLLCDPEAVTGQSQATVVCLGADLEARGLAGIAQQHGVGVIDDAALVQLVCAHTHCLSWK